MFIVRIMLEKVCETKDYYAAVATLLEGFADLGNASKSFTTASWIECHGVLPSNGVLVMNMNEMCDVAHLVGVMKNGAIVDRVPDIDEDQLRKELQLVASRQLKSVVTSTDKLIEEVRQSMQNT